MKAKTPKVEKIQEPRLEWRAPIYSPGALKMMEDATGQRFTQLAAAPKPVPAQATDGD